MKLSDFKKIKLPEQPGVYFFIKDKKVLYIGKATSLKSRVRSYFSSDLINTRGPLLIDMVFKAGEIKWQGTDSVLEALILEANLIKKYQPYYNTKEKDDKSFNYVCITREELPRILTVRGKNLIKENYSKTYGPFPNGLQLRTALELIRRIFPFLDEKSRIKGTYEFYKQIKLAPEQKEILLKNIKNIKLFFEGKKKSILKNLEKEMKLYAKKKEFEKAGEIKRQIFALQHINDVALIKNDYTENHINSLFRIEAYDIAHMSGKNMVGVMIVVENGEVSKNEYRKFKIKNQTGANDTRALSEILDRRFNHSEWRFPDMVVIDGSTAQISVTQKVIRERNIQTNIVAVTKDDRHKAKEIKGDADLIRKYKSEILLANSEAHRFAINYHKNMRAKNFLK
ncbi:MAG: UvrB/UvrC motif-containing protein [bacterium]|nr:UvrB/UvrC motif-containing protein [bacterium]